MLKSKAILEENMKGLKSLLVSSLTIAGLLLAGAAAKADPVTITFTSVAFQSGSGGETLTFDVNVTNNVPVEWDFNSDSLNISSAGGGLVVNDEFNANAPFTLGAGDSAAFEAFTIFIPNGTASGLYEGSYEILGGLTSSDPNFTDSALLGSADFDVNVTPEPSSFLLMGSGLLALAGAARRRIWN